MASTISAGTTAGTAIAIAGDTSGVLQLQTNGTTAAVTIDTSQNVGIGTSSPNQRLQVNSSAASGGQIQVTNASTGTGSTDGVLFGYDGSNDVIVNNQEATATKFFTSGTERMRITSGGTLIVNDTATSAFFDGRVSSFSATLPGLSGKTSGGPAMPAITSWNTATSGDNLFLQFATETSATARGSIDYNRGAGLTRYNTTSDATLKNIIGDADKQKSVEILNTTKIREYAWKDDAEQKPQIGVIAQELYETYKGAVSVGGYVEKTDEEGNVTTQYNPWGVDKTAFTFHLIAGWQEHEKMIKELKALVEAQAVRIAELEGAK